MQNSKTFYFWRSQKGLTLIEVLIAMGIATVAGGLLLVIIVNSAGLFYKQSSEVSLGLSTNDALMKIRGSIKQAGSIAQSYPETGAPIYTTGSTRLILKIPSTDNLGNIISDTYDYFVYFSDQTKLRLKSFPNVLSAKKAQDQIFMTNLKSLEFKYLNSTIPPQEVPPRSASKVRLTVTVEEKSGARLESLTATSEASLRND